MGVLQGPHRGTGQPRRLDRLPGCVDLTALPFPPFIVYRRLTMNEIVGPLNRAIAAEYASWFKALADATRVQIVSLLARRGGPMSVGAITAALDVGQSTVSAHLKVLFEVRFVLVERRGTSALYRINEVPCVPPTRARCWLSTRQAWTLGRPASRRPRQT